MADHPSAPPLVDRERIRALIDAFRAGEDPDLSQICGALWELLYARIPRLTVSKEKSEQHRILESYLVELGLPASPDLQYIAGPVLWFAREKRLIPPAQANGRGPEVCRIVSHQGIRAAVDRRFKDHLVVGVR